MQDHGRRPPARLFASEDSVSSIAHGLLDRTLPKSLWTHEAHFGATIWLLLHRTDLELAQVLPGLIQAYNVASGGVNSDTAGYHATITLASLHAARLYADVTRRDDDPPSAMQATNALLASLYGNPDWLLNHWSPDRLFSVAARRGWLAPDLQALPLAAGTNELSVARRTLSA